MAKQNVRRLKKPVVVVIILIIIFILGLLYGRFIGTSGLFIKEYKITNNIISDSFHGFKIVHITDIHFGRTTNKKELDNLVKKINSLKPDIVVLTGDLIDRNTKLTDEKAKIISDCLSNITVNIKKYAINGNHDYKFDKWEDIILESGFTNLNDSYDIIYNGKNDSIFIGGMSTNSYGTKTAKEKMDDINNKYEEIKGDSNITYSILLMHEPDFIDDIDYSRFNLILAGHSHNGQVRFPIVGATILPPNAKKYYKEYYKLNDVDFYISSGIGTSTVSLRLFNHPSINFYRLTNK